MRWAKTPTNCRSTSSALMTACSSGGCRALDRKGLIMPSLRIWQRQNIKTINAWFCKLAKWPFKSKVNAKSALTRKYFFITTVRKQSSFSHKAISWKRGLLLCSEVAYWGKPGPGGSHQLHGEARNSGWKIKWFGPFHLEASENMSCV